MRSLKEIYTERQIMPVLQIHQVRVAAIGKTVAESLTRELDKRSIILACLFHDMGNIIKSDLSHFREFFEPDSIAKWELIKKEFVQKYGDLAHTANVAIARELGLPENVVDLIDGVGFGNLKKTAWNATWEQKIVEYADGRVGPYGVLPLRQRFEEARARYLLLPDTDKNAFSKEQFEDYVHDAETIEAELFSGSSITPADITDASIEPAIDLLWDYSVGL